MYNSRLAHGALPPAMRDVGPSPRNRPSEDDPPTNPESPELHGVSDVYHDIEEYEKGEQDLSVKLPGGALSEDDGDRSLEQERGGTSNRADALLERMAGRAPDGRVSISGSEFGAQDDSTSSATPQPSPAPPVPPSQPEPVASIPTHAVPTSLLADGYSNTASATDTDPPPIMAHRQGSARAQADLVIAGEPPAPPTPPTPYERPISSGATDPPVAAGVGEAAAAAGEEAAQGKGSEGGSEKEGAEAPPPLELDVKSQSERDLILAAAGMQDEKAEEEAGGLASPGARGADGGRGSPDARREGGQILPEDEVVLAGLPASFGRYEGKAGIVQSVEEESGKVWIKLPDEIRELPIKVALSSVSLKTQPAAEAKSGAPSSGGGGAAVTNSKKSGKLMEGVSVTTAFKDESEDGLKKEDRPNPLADFQPHKLEPISEEAADEDDEDEEGRERKDPKKMVQEEWDPKERWMWEEKIKMRMPDMAKVSNLVRSMGRSELGIAKPAVEKQLSAQERAEAERQRMEEEKKQRREEERRRRLEGPQALIPGLVSNPDESGFTLMMMAVTIFALWGVDIYNMLDDNPLKNDKSFYTVVLISFTLFCVEFIFYTLFKPGYFLSFFFYLDFISTISLLPDFLLLWDYHLFGDGGDSGSSTIARAGRAARAGTRAARIVRIFKAFSLMKKGRKNSNRQTSKVGQLVNDGIQRKIILIVAVMLIVQEILLIIADLDGFLASATSFQNELARLELLLNITGGDVNAAPFAPMAMHFIRSFNCERSDANNPFSDLVCPEDCPEATEESLGTYQETIKCKFRYLRVNGKDVWGYGPSGRTWRHDLRIAPMQRRVASLHGSRRCQGFDNASIGYDTSVLLFDAVSNETGHWFPDVSALRAGYGTTTGCTAYPCNGEDGEGEPDPCTMLVLETTADTKSLALESVVTVVFVTIVLGAATANFGGLVNKLVIVPLETMTAMVRGLMKDPMAKMSADSGTIDADSETKSIAAALIKLSTMLQIAFGEAGSTIITENLNSGSEVNALIPGKRLQGVFGFCDIRSFTDCTECLQEEVMIFVNRIADFVHRAVSENEGAPNKNVGDAFQLAWRLPERRVVGEAVSTADAALRAVLRIIFETSTCPALYRLTMKEELQARIPNYSTRFGFGLHAGWAIEGAIGSALKIDPSYLSPNVKWSERLEGATKIYGVLVLMTDSFYDLLSPPVQKLCRKVDKIKVPDSKTPIDLFTYDTKAFHLDDTEMKFIAPFGNTFWESFPPITTEPWRRQFEKALIPYFKGQWDVAKELMEECLREFPDDKPGKHVLATMAEHNFVSPASWKGYRETDDI